MKILILSDVIFDVLKREILKSENIFDIHLEYNEDLNSTFYNENFNNYDYIYFHTDLYFQTKSIDWQKQFLNNLNFSCKQYPLKKFIVSNTFNLGFTSLGRQNIYSEIDTQYFSFQDEIKNLLNENNFFFFDIKKILFNSGFHNCYNFVLGAMYQMPYKKNFITNYAIEFINFFNFLINEEKKAIIVDCDNTLWNGILGEDGIDNVKCNKNVDGIVFYNFQNFLKQKLSEGFILCICSKNNDHEVESLFRLDKFPLKWDDFLLKKINWVDKSQNIKEIAKDLNIGEESIIFIDDNQFELNSVFSLTGVKNGFLIENNFEKLFSITNDYLFKRKKILKEDLEKNSKYKLEQIRREETIKFQNIDDYILSLNLQLKILENDVSNFERISQMTEKTNQFNFNKKVYGINELNNWIKSGNIIFSASLVDKFGDYGIIGLIFLERIDINKFNVENFLVSCRALGKKIEDKFFNSVEDKLKKLECEIVNIYFKKTAKNIPADIFIQKLIKYGYNIRQIK